MKISHTNVFEHEYFPIYGINSHLHTFSPYTNTSLPKKLHTHQEEIVTNGTHLAGTKC